MPFCHSHTLAYCTSVIKRISVIIILLFLSCTNKPKDVEYPPIADRFIQSDERSCEAVFATKYETAEELLKDFYDNAKYKDSLELNLRLGTHFYYKKQYDTALYFYNKAERIDKSEPELYYNISLAYSEKKEFDIALENIDKALAICGDRWDLLNSKCFILGKLDRCEEAIEAGQISKRENPENIKIYGNLLRCFDKLNEPDSVKKYINLIDTKFNETADWVDELRVKYN